LKIEIHPSKTEIEKEMVDVDKLYRFDIQYLEDYRTIILSGTRIYQGFKHGMDCFIGHNTVIREDVTIANNVKISSLCSIESRVIIGDHNNIQANCYIGEHTAIGSHNFIAPGVVITSDKYPPGTHTPVTIGDFNVIGSHSTIIPGVKIKDYIVIGMGSRVTKDKLKSGVYIDDKYIYDINTYHKKRSGKNF